MVPVFAGGLDFSLPVRKFFYDPLGSGKAFVDCIVSLTGFALVGGPARQDAPKVPSHLALSGSPQPCPIQSTLNERSSHACCKIPSMSIVADRLVYFA